MQSGPGNIIQRAVADVYTNPNQPGRPARRSKRGLGIDKVILLLVILYLLVPLGASLAFGIFNGSNFDLSAMQRTFNDPDFGQTLLTSLELALATTIIMIVLVTPTAYWVELRLPKLRPLLEFLSLVPFAMPAIVLSVGLLQEYSGTSGPLINTLSLGIVPFLSSTLNIINTPPLLVCAYVIIALPFVYRAIDNSLRSINTTVLTEAAYSLGSGWWRTFLMVILPNILPGVISAALLTFSTVMGEFTLASLFSIYTFPIFLNTVGQNDPHQAALLSVVSFLFTLICVLAIIVLVRSRRHRTGDTGGQVDIAGAR
jgi:putative spermidine/putrescine transport system permease protein